MSQQIIFEQQYLPYAPDPNVAEPAVEVLNGNVILDFPIQEQGKLGKILFEECVIYRVGSPNDEGFYSYGFDPKMRNDSSFSKKEFPELEFHSFYKIIGMDWKKGLLGEGVVILDGEFKNKNQLSHFVFFMKEATFECVAKSYEILE
jgi:hypothetical protein